MRQPAVTPFNQSHTVFPAAVRVDIHFTFYRLSFFFSHGVASSLTASRFRRSLKKNGIRWWLKKCLTLVWVENLQRKKQSFEHDKVKVLGENVSEKADWAFSENDMYYILLLFGVTSPVEHLNISTQKLTSSCYSVIYHPDLVYFSKSWCKI